MSTTEKKNSNLHSARRAKNDEFYTRLEDIEKELRYYSHHFKDKTVFLNCDDPYESDFFKYFAMNFEHLGLKKLISVSYANSLLSKESHKVEITEVPDFNGDGVVNLIDVEELLKMDANTIATLKGDGDFRSDESVELLKQSDIVVTNPPFSLFREFISQLIEYGKEFLVIGNMNAITYKEIWPLIQAADLWLGVQSPKRFIVGDTMPDKAGQTINQSGKREQAFGNIRWFTNLGHAKRHEELPLWKKYTPEEYPKYDNYDAINVDKVKDIPVDYTVERWVTDEEFEKLTEQGFVLTELATDGRTDGRTDEASASGEPGYRSPHHVPRQVEPAAVRDPRTRQLSSSPRSDRVADDRRWATDLQPNTRSGSRRWVRVMNPAMGVPITFLDKWNPEQFQIVDANLLSRGVAMKPHGLIKDKDSAIDGKPKYVRIAIRQVIVS